MFMSKLADQYKELIQNYSLDDEMRKFFVFRYYCLTKDEKIPSELFKKDNSFDDLRMYILAGALIKANALVEDMCAKSIESVKSYEKILNNTISLAQELDFDTSLEISILYSYLLWNGYYSVTGKHIYDIRNHSVIYPFSSFDIMFGKGVCFNYSQMLADLLNKSNYSSALLVNEFGNDIKKSYIPDIETHENKPNILQKIGDVLCSKTISRIGNHAFVLITSNHWKYIFDPTNLMVFKIDNRNYASNIVGSGTVELKTMLSYFYNHDSSALTLDLLYLDDEFICPYDRSDIVFGFEEKVAFLKERKKELDDFHLECMPDIQNISRHVQSYRKGENVLTFKRR